MAVPSKSWTDIPDSKVDVDSPVTEELKTFERDNAVNLDERIADPTDFPASRTTKSHSHDDVDSKLIALTNQGATLGRLIYLETGNEAGDPRRNPMGFTPQITFSTGLYGTPGAIRLNIDDAGTIRGANLSSAASSTDVAKFIFGGIEIETGIHSQDSEFAVLQNIADAIKFFVYTGDGSNPRNITGIGFDPDAVILSGTAGANRAFAKTSGHAGANSRNLDNGNNQTNAITALITDGFTVESEANANGTVYIGVAFIDTSPSVISGNGVKILNYSGDATSNRTLTGMGFRPDLLFVINTTAVSLRNSLYRTRGLQAGRTAVTTSGVHDIGGTRLDEESSDGFITGTDTTSDSSANRAGQTYSAIGVKVGFTP